MAQFDQVVQEDEWGCGAACVASLLGCPYSVAKKLVEDIKGIAVDDEQRPGLDLHHLALALREQGVKVVADWEERLIFPVGSIVCIADNKKHKDEHYMLKTPHGWMDPWANMGTTPRTSAYRDRFPDGTWFLVALVPKGA
jgi:hypothetical protein